MSKLLEALDRFDALFRRAASCDLNEPTAVTVATVGAGGRPSARVVLLKGYDPAGFVFYTNTLSRKGRELVANPRVAMCLFWDPLMEQVRIEGHVRRVTEAEADAYWASRHPGSQIGAWASNQSEPLESREALEARIASFAERFGDGPVPRPAHWSGYRVVPDRIEFWRSLPHRLHERTCYSLEGGEWRMSLLNP
ncbi:MAG: pyridoxamine 5'-phosphate oxidase [Thiotrichales bacterium]|nr:pyridoxamine 5'-phosphate oxidase [Thiotrichales bacterium]